MEKMWKKLYLIINYSSLFTIYDKSKTIIIIMIIIK